MCVKQIFKFTINKMEKKNVFCTIWIVKCSRDTFCTSELFIFMLLWLHQSHGRRCFTYQQQENEERKEKEKLNRLSVRFCPSWLSWSHGSRFTDNYETILVKRKVLVIVHWADEGLEFLISFTIRKVSLFPRLIYRFMQAETWGSK